MSIVDSSKLYLYFCCINSHGANTFELIAGSGREENRNNMYILKSSFAQPSGIACSQGINENDKIIYIADAESSSIRYVNSGGRVMPLVGGSRDPAVSFYIILLKLNPFYILH